MGLFDRELETARDADRIHELELENATLRVHLEHASDAERELRDRVQQLEAQTDKLVRRLLKLTRPIVPPPAPSAAPMVAMPTGPTLGPKALRAIAVYAGRDKTLGQHLMQEALGMLAADPDLTDAQIAAKIIEGEDPEGLDSGDDDVATAGGRVIPGGSD